MKVIKQEEFLSYAIEFLEHDMDIQKFLGFNKTYELQKYLKERLSRTKGVWNKMNAIDKQRIKELYLANNNNINKAITEYVKIYILEVN